MRQDSGFSTYDNLVVEARSRDGERIITSIRAMMAAIRQQATHLPEPDKNAGRLKKIECNLPEDKEHYCCAITFECMDEPVIDPTTLVVADDPNTGKPFIDPKLPAQFKNFDDAPRYDKRSLIALATTSGKIKSPNTRIEFDATQLVPDTKLQSEIIVFIKKEEEEYQRRYMHHVIIEPRRSEILKLINDTEARLNHSGNSASPAGMFDASRAQAMQDAPRTLRPEDSTSTIRAPMSHVLLKPIHR